MPTREETIRIAVELLDGGLYPSGLTEYTYGLGIYQVLLWYEDVGFLNIERLPHIIDADKLRPSPSKRTNVTTKKPSVWQERALKFERYLADELSIIPSEVPDYVDLLLKAEGFRGYQRQNPLGIAFGGLVSEGLSRYSSGEYYFTLEVPSDRIFPGIKFPGRSTKPKADILIFKNDLPVAIISAKWSLRHDRINDITNECPVYKAAAYRQSRCELKFFVITNEFDPARLDKVMSDECVNNVVHVDKRAVTEICDLDGRLTSLVDLTDFFTLVSDI